MAGHSRSKDGVASLACVPPIPIIWLSARLSEIAGSRPAMTTRNLVLAMRPASESFSASRQSHEFRPSFFASLTGRKKEAERRQAPGNNLRTIGCGCVPCERHARLSASHRGSTPRDFRPVAQLQASLPGTRFRRVLPATPLSQSSDSTSRTGRSTGEEDARSCPGTECMAPRAGTALAPPSRIPSRKASVSERDVAPVCQRGNDVKRFVRHMLCAGKSRGCET